MLSTLSRKAFSSKSTSGNRITTGIDESTSPPAAAIHPACLPITSRTKTLVDVAAIEATSKLASIVDTAPYFATEPQPGQLSVTGKSLSTVLGMWMACIGYPILSES